VCVSSAKSVCDKCAVAVDSVSTNPTTRALEPKMSVPTVPCRWCLFLMSKVSVPNVLWQLFQCQQSQRQERWSQNYLCPLCRVAGACFQCQKCMCQMCCGSCFSVNKANDKNAGAKVVCAHCAVSSTVRYTMVRKHLLAPTIYMAASAMKDQSTYVAATTQTMRTVGRRTLHKYSTYCTQTSWLSA